MKKKVCAFLLIAVMTVSIFSLNVSADMGPKPSVRIVFENMGDELCYGTLLSKQPSTGPASVWDGNEDHIYINYELNRVIWQAFVDYRDADGFYFLQWGALCNESKSLNWTYYPPSTFKILLYYPDTETFVVSEICERYAFDSYFTVNMAGISIDSVSQSPALSPVKSYNYTWELISFVCRVILTILVELGIALLFGFGQKKMLFFIGGVNIVTQFALNIALNLTNYYQGSLAFVFNYVWLEFVVLAVEAVTYVVLSKKLCDKQVKSWKAIVYALVANAVSFAVGMAVAKLIPGIF